MKIDIQDVNSYKKTFRVEIPLEDVNAEFEKAYDEVRKNIDVPGFRKGRAPRNILKMRFGEYVKNEVIENLVPSAYQKAIEDSKLEVIGSPDINPPSEDVLFIIEADIKNELDNGELSEALKDKFNEKEISISDKAVISVSEAEKKWLLTDGKKKYLINKDNDKFIVRIDELNVKENEPFIFEIEVNIKPDISIPEYSFLEIDKIDVNVIQDEVEEYLNRLRDNRANFIPIEDRPIQDGDFAHFALRVLQDDRIIEDRDDAVLEVKSDALIPDLYENLLGMNIGDEKEVSLTMPEDHGNKDLAGKEIQFYLKFTGNTEKHLPDLDDDFAKDIQEESLEKLKVKVWNNLVEMKRKQKREDIESDLVTQLIEKTQFDVSEELIEAQTKRFVKDMDDVSDEDLASYRSLSERIIRRTWILDKIAEKENLEVSDEELDAEVSAMAISRGKDPQKYMSQLKATKRLDNIRDSITEKRIFNMLIERASEKKSLIL